jgi:SPP1 gp7 family putative phage head morphogenesis protein
MKLTKKQLRKIRANKPQTIQGSPLNPSAISAIRYRTKLDRLITEMTNATMSAVRKLYNAEPAQQYFAQDDKSIVAEAKRFSSELQKQFEALFSDKATTYATEMVDDANKASASGVKISLQQLTGGLSLPTTGLNGEIGEVLKASVAENVALIKSIPMQYLEQVQGAVLRSITNGQGLADLVPFLEQQKGITLRRAKMIAHDQTRKAYNNISKGRLQAAGLKKFEWLHTGGSNHPRKEHIAMNGNVYRFDDPPIIDIKTGQRGIPGDAINCRCRIKPVIEFED